MNPTSPTVPSLSLHAAVIAVALAAGCARAVPTQRATDRAELPDVHALPSVALPPELDRVLRDYEVAWSARSADALARLFTDDGFVLQPGQTPVRGHDEIVRAYTGAGGPLSLRALGYANDGDVGYIVGAFAGAAGDPDIGKFILVVRRESGGPWKIAADMDNGTRHR